MDIFRIEQQEAANQYIIITKTDNVDEVSTSQILVTDNFSNNANIVNVTAGSTGPMGPPGQNAITFDLLPIISGGTNNTSFAPGKVIYFNHLTNQLSSSDLSIQDILTTNTNIVAGTGLAVVDNHGSITIHSNLGSGLRVDANNRIVVDFDLIDNKILESVNFTIGSGLILENSSIKIGSSSDITVNENNIELTTIVTSGTYTKVTVDPKGRITEGTVLSSEDLRVFNGALPWHPGNDGDNSGLDADMLDGQQADFFLNANNLTGVINPQILPTDIAPGSYVKLQLTNKGIIESASNDILSEITGSLGFMPLSPTGGNIVSLKINNNIFEANTTKIFDNTPLLGNNSLLSSSSPRGFSFLYGSPNSIQTGIFGYFPLDNSFKIVTNDTETVLTNKTASGFLAQLFDNNEFHGINTFTDQVYINNLDVTKLTTSSSGLVSNLNADLLDNKQGSFYLNAGNHVGVLNPSGFPVTVSNISGTKNYLAKFDNRTNDPSRTISDSIVSENENTLYIEDGNLVVGHENIINNSFDSLIVGNNNSINNSNSSISLGSSHNIEANYGFAANFSNSVENDFSSVFGQHGISWAPNQIAVGSFKEEDSELSGKGQGQYSVTTTYFYGIASDFENMLPDRIFIPQNKTILYSFEVLMNKLGSHSSAAIKFENGIVKNLNRRNPNNLAVNQNITYELKKPEKQTIYNNSYLRNYTLALGASNVNTEFTTIKVVDNPTLKNDEIQNIPIISNTSTTKKSRISSIQNLPKNKLIDYNVSQISGMFVYDTAHDYLTLYCDKPRNSGYFIQNNDDYQITLLTKDHGAVLSCDLETVFVTGYNYTPPNGSYTVTEVVNKNTVKLSLLDSGHIESINQNNIVIKLIDEIKHDYTSSAINKFYIEYLNNNHIVVSDIYILDSYNSETNTLSGTFDHAIISSNTDLFCVQDASVRVAPASANSGLCNIIPKKSFKANITNINKGSDITSSKALYVQYEQNSNGVVSFNGIQYSQDFDSQTYSSNDTASWNIASGLWENLPKKAYLEFVRYIKIPYETHDGKITFRAQDTFSYAPGNFPYLRLMLTTPHREGFYEWGQNQSYENRNILIKKINNTAVDLYSSLNEREVNSGFNDIFYFFDTTVVNNWEPTGYITITDSGNYNNGCFPDNGVYNICDINYENQTFVTQAAVKCNEQNYPVSGSIGVYIKPETISLNLVLDDLDDTFNRGWLQQPWQNYIPSDDRIASDLGDTVFHSKNLNFIPISGSTKSFISFDYLGNNLYDGVFENTLDGNFISFTSTINTYAPISNTLVNEFSTSLIVESEDYYNIGQPTAQRPVTVTVNQDHNISTKLDRFNYIPIQFSSNTQDSWVDDGLYFVSGVFGDLVFLNMQTKKLRVKNNKIKPGEYLASGIDRDDQYTPLDEGESSYSIRTIVLTDSTSLNLYGLGNNQLVTLNSIPANINYNNTYKVTNISSTGVELVSSNSAVNAGFLSPTFSTESSIFPRISLIHSGTFVIPTNNLFFSTYIEEDNFYHRWQLDDEGNTIENPFLCSYIMNNDPGSCGDDNICVSVFPFSSSQLPLSVNDQCYLAYDPPLFNQNGVYTITNTGINNSIFYFRTKNLASISVPRSGYVNLIPHGKQNIIVNIESNINNEFNTLSTTLKIDDINTNYEQLTLFDSFGKRQLNSIVLQPEVVLSESGIVISDTIQSGLLESSFNEKYSFNFGYLPINNIEIEDILFEYVTPTQDHWNLVSNEPISLKSSSYILDTIYTDVNFLLHIKTRNMGDHPLVNLYGVYDYSVSNIENNTISVLCSGFKNVSNNRNIEVGLQNYSDSVYQNIKFSTKSRLSVETKTAKKIPSNTDIFKNLIVVKGLEPLEKTNLTVSCLVAGNLMDMKSSRWENLLNGFSILHTGQLLNASSYVYDITLNNQHIHFTGSITEDNLTVSDLIYNFNEDTIIFEPSCNSYHIPIIIDNSYNTLPTTTNLNLFVNNLNNYVQHPIVVEYCSLLERYLINIRLNNSIPPGLYENVHFAIENFQTNKNILVTLPLTLTKVVTDPFLVSTSSNNVTYSFSLQGGLNTSNQTYANKIKTHASGISTFDTLSSINPGLTTNEQIFTNFILRQREYDNKLFVKDSGIISLYVDDSYFNNVLTFTYSNLEQDAIFNLPSSLEVNHNKEVALTIDSTKELDIQKNNAFSIFQPTFTRNVKYDPNLDIFVNRLITTTSLSGMWDADISMVNLAGIAISPENFSDTVLSTRCKGNLDDNIYCVGKLTTLEVSNSFINVPLQLFVDDSITVNPGEPWEIELSACYGIANTGYPPRISISGAPTACTGFVNENDNDSNCYIPNSKTFNPVTQCWKFVFKGDALCEFDSVYNVTITASDYIDDFFVSEDTKIVPLLFLPLDPTPVPSINFNAENLKIYPECTDINIPWSGSAGLRDICPDDSVYISGFVISGQLPSGLTIQISSIEPNNVFPTENLTRQDNYNILYTLTNFPSGTKRVVGSITGRPSFFGDETLTITGVITDNLFRDNFAIQSFNNDTLASENLVRHGVLYFPDSNYIRITTLGTFMGNDSAIITFSPPPAEESFDDLSTLLENQPYRGTYVLDESNAIKIINSNKPLPSFFFLDNPKVMIKFMGETNTEARLYTIIASSETDFMVIAPDVTNFNSECLFVFPKNVTSMGQSALRLGEYQGMPPKVVSINSKHKELLGAGEYDFGNNTINGYIRPSYDMSFLNPDISGPVRYSIDRNRDFSVLYSGLSVEPIDGICCSHNLNAIIQSNCYETGIARISGLVVPKPRFGASDIPSNLILEKSESVIIDLSYGVTSSDFNNPVNKRLTNVDNSNTTIEFYETRPSLELDRFLTTSNIQPGQINNTFDILPTTTNILTNNGTGYILQTKITRRSDWLNTNGDVIPQALFNPLSIPGLQTEFYIPYIHYENFNSSNPQASVTIASTRNYAAHVPIFTNPIRVKGNDFTFNGKMLGGVATIISVNRPIQIQDTFTNQQILSANDNTLFQDHPPIYTGLVNKAFEKTLIIKMNISGFPETDMNLELDIDNHDLTEIYDNGSFIILESGAPTTPISLATTGYILDRIIEDKYNIPLSSSESSLFPFVFTNSDITFYSTKAYRFENNTISPVPTSIQVNINDRLNFEPMGHNFNSQSLLSATGFMTVTGITSSSLLVELSEPLSIIDNSWGKLYKIIDPNPLVYSNIEFIKEGEWNISVTGNLDPGQYQYQFLTIENTGLFLFNTFNESPRKFDKVYNLSVDSDYRVYTLDNLNDPVTSINQNINNEWVFYLAGGPQPVSDFIPVLEINNSIYGLLYEDSKNLSKAYTITYDSYLDMYLVTIIKHSRLDEPQFMSKCLSIRHALSNRLEIMLY